MNTYHRCIKYVKPKDCQTLKMWIFYTWWINSKWGHGWRILGVEYDVCKNKVKNESLAGN